MFGTIKGYAVRTVGIRHIRKDAFTAQLSAHADADVIRKTAIAALESRGRVYGLFDRDHACLSLYVFQRVTTKDESGKIIHALVLTGSYQALTDAAAAAEFEQAVRKEINDYLLLSDNQYYDWNGERVDAEVLERDFENRYHINNNNFFLYLVIFGLLFHSFPIGLLFAVLLSGSHKANAGTSEKVSLRKE